MGMLVKNPCHFLFARTAKLCVGITTTYTTRIAIAMPATDTAMRMIITTKTDAMTAADDRPASGVLSGTLDDASGILDAEVEDEVSGSAREETAV